jgi:hypothetical protein
MHPEMINSIIPEERYFIMSFSDDFICETVFCKRSEAKGLVEQSRQRRKV